MESVGTLSEGDQWGSFSGMFSTEEADFMSQLLGSYSFGSDEHDQGSSLVHPSAFWSCHEPTTNLAMVDENSYYSSDNNVNSTSQYFSHGGGYSSGTGLFLQTPGNENYYLNNSIPVLMTNNNSSVSMDYCMVDEQINTGLSTKIFLDNVMEDASVLNEDVSNDNLRESSGTQSEPVCLHDQNFQTKRKCEMSEPDTMTDDQNNVNSSESPKKKSRVSGDVQKKKRNVQSKRNLKGVAISNDEEEKQSSSSSSSEEDSNALQEPNGGEDSSTKASALNLNGKTRASRGSATDPQSLYARKRRERINERLRILQNLVPNGTKVDISTMLEEAVDYVKFLQLQIKLLSSDDLWMYAPIAYNGMNIGLDLKVSPPQQQ